MVREVKDERVGEGMAVKRRRGGWGRSHDGEIVQRKGNRKWEGSLGGVRAGELVSKERER